MSLVVCRREASKPLLIFPGYLSGGVEQNLADLGDYVREGWAGCMRVSFRLLAVK